VEPFPDADANRDRVNDTREESQKMKTALMYISTHIPITRSFRAALEGELPCDPLTGHRLVPPPSWIAFADGEEDTTDSGKTYTQEDLERIVKQRIKKSESALARAQKEAEQNAKKVEELSTKFDELNTKYESTNKSEIERELAQLQRTVAKLQKDNEGLVSAKTEAEKMAMEAVSGLQRTKLETSLRDGLRAHKAHGKGMDQAVKLMLAEGAKFDENGDFAFTVDEVPYDNPKEAAQKWLEANPHFMEGSPGGSGSPRPGGSVNLLNQETMKDMSPTALIQAGLSTDPG
jgi:hypothetical protein